MNALRERLADSLRAFGDVYANANLRRLELAWVGSMIGTWSYSVALMVYAYHAGGPGAVGLAGLIRWFPAGLASPFAGMLGDRYPRLRVMKASDLVRAAAMAGVTAAVILDAPAVTVYVLAAFVAVVSTAFQPAQAALLPTLARTPEELTAANVSSTTIEAVGFFVGPALGGVLLAATSTEVVFAATGGTFVWSALLLSLIRLERADEVRAARAHGLGREALAGFATILADARLRLIVALFAGQTLIYGAFSILVAVAAIRLLGLGSPGVGYLTAAMGVGGLVGGFLALSLVGVRRLALAFGVGLILWGTPIVIMGAAPEAAVAFVMVALVGVALTLVDVAGITVLQRNVADEVLSRVFGVLHSFFFLTAGVGAIVAPALVDWLGVRGALITIGLYLPASAVLSLRQLAAIDAAAVVPTRELEQLRAIPIFAPLSAPALERLADLLERVRVPAGEVIFRQGDPGDRFYITAEGEVEIVVDERPPVVVGPGGYFGEIALLGSIPRTATARARTEVELYALDGDEFVAAVVGDAASAAAAEGVISARLGLATAEPG
jgi:MFS family permease